MRHPLILEVVTRQDENGNSYYALVRDGQIYLMTPGASSIDKLIAEDAAKRWNAHKPILWAAQALISAAPLIARFAAEWDDWHAATTRIKKVMKDVAPDYLDEESDYSTQHKTR